MREGKLLLLLLLTACGSRVGSIQFKGQSHPAIATAEQLATFAGRNVPAGYKTIGVAAAQCATLDGSGGLVEAPCSKISMLKSTKQAAARAGGSALLDVLCSEDTTDRRLQRRNNRTGASSRRGAGNGSGATVTVRTLIGCRATVLRHSSGKRTDSTHSPLGAIPGSKQKITVADTPVTIAIARVNTSKQASASSVPAQASIAAEDIGVVAEAPAGTRAVAHVAARCDRGCARNTARRALREAAARSGATLLSALHCQLEGDRWRCKATALKATSPTPAASTSGSPASSPAIAPKPEG
jgi:hypothetical protein